MEEKIFGKLKEKLGKTGLSERTLREYAKAMAKKVTTDELLTAEVIEEAVAMLKTIEGQVNHEVATKTKETEKTFEEKYKGYKKPEEEVEDGKKPTPSTTDEVISKLQDRLDALEKEKENGTKAAKAKELREKVLAELKDKGSDNPLILRIVMAETSIDEEADVETNLSNFKKAYDKEAKELSAESHSPLFGSSFGSTETEVSDEARAKAIEERKKKRTLKT